MAGKLRVTLTKSVVSTTREAHGTVRALGLHRIGETVELPDNPAIRGQVRAVQYLVRMEAIPDEQAPKRATHRATGGEGEETAS
jgi:large subunit ribosomal protein L30